uniref:Uncharacterized protein n=1 Tax=viral metagenome TaxID=1070528 RepID=A0A6C0FEG6_9ZZZZ|tara:strand:+ start:149 stop:526 length:378 start_codon:yes stop_codon:yes gene_type:complete
MEKWLDSMRNSLSCINENKYIIGLTMIMLNIGARFIIDELDDDLRKLISNTIVRRVVIFCSFFMATKDLFTATVLTIVFVILINEVFAQELDELDDNKDEKKGGSFNKNEIEKVIQQLKTVQMNM